MKKVFLFLLFLPCFVNAVDFQPVFIQHNESWKNATIKFIDKSGVVVAVESFTGSVNKTSAVYYVTNMSVPYYYSDLYNVSIKLDSKWVDDLNVTPSFLGRGLVNYTTNIIDKPNMTLYYNGSYINDTYVPYVGAVKEVDLHNLSVEYIRTSSDSISIDPTTRALYDSTGVDVIDYETCVLDSNLDSYQSVDWGNRVLYNNANNPAIDYSMTDGIQLNSGGTNTGRLTSATEGAYFTTPYMSAYIADEYNQYAVSATHNNNGGGSAGHFQSVVGTVDLSNLATNDLVYAPNGYSYFGYLSVGTQSHQSAYMGVGDGNAFVNLCDGSGAAVWADYNNYQYDTFLSSSSGAVYSVDSNGHSVYLADGTKAGYFADGTTSSTFNDGTTAGYFMDGSSHTVSLADGTQAGYFTDGTYTTSLAGSSTYAGTFSDTSGHYVAMCDGSTSLYASDGSVVANLAYGGIAGKFEDNIGSVVQLSDGTNAMDVTGSVKLNSIGSTGSNAGSQVCIDANSQLCICGSCA